MQVRADQIEEHLRHTLASVYLVSGDEPLQVMETADAIRKAAASKGFSERDVLTVDAQFDWGALYDAAGALSLFADKKLLDVRMTTCKAGVSGTKALQHYLDYLPPDKILLMQCGRLDKACKSAAWVKKIEQVGVSVQVWDLSPAQTLAWIARRMKQAGLQPDTEAVRYLTERVEGNLLAAVQEIGKLVLLYGSRPMTAANIMAVVSDNSRFSVFDLAEAMLSQDARRVRHIMQVLQEEDTATPLLIWALGDLLRQLYTGCDNVRNNASNQALLMRMPKTRHNLFQNALRRMMNADWDRLFTLAAHLDQHSKGVGIDVSRHPQRLWDEMLTLALLLSGRSLSV
ncbi:DNA polymerase III subunit delta [Thiothrix fructosivorans]|uniref:DNA polymerase III subunit delta n=1 Tax=Thiothrix fructosivorans TaxID=111770 RepID=A0A8B0SEL1_9GAMM|nr:DNA polymerase III subunit delta [Thiothrix fructosivorans]MBO0611878.1 DNA polymerase III subunit delta [Thiothrix fructosivorans]QTX10473.1 DNA polymerase III subunit delta [Thiothrix fructosivorans]